MKPKIKYRCRACLHGVIHLTSPYGYFGHSYIEWTLDPREHDVIHCGGYWGMLSEEEIYEAKV